MPQCFMPMPTFQVMTQKMPEIFVPSVFALVDDISAVALLETCQARACVCVHSSLYDYVQEFWGWVCWCVLQYFPFLLKSRTFMRTCTNTGTQKSSEDRPCNAQVHLPPPLLPLHLTPTHIFHH